jgi:hypothetical protein
MKTENERLDSQEAEKKTERQLTTQKVQDDVTDKFRKHDKFQDVDVLFWWRDAGQARFLALLSSLVNS